MTAPPADYDSFKTEIAARYESLSMRLRQVAQFVLQHPNDLALETISVISARAGVQPSTLIRFAKAFGYDGFTEMQRVFRARLVASAPTYNERIRALRRKRGAADLSNAWAVLDEFVAISIASLEHLRDSVPPDGLKRSLRLLAEASEIHVIGQRRSFPVACYLAYGFRQLNLRAHLLDGIGGMLSTEAALIAPGDALVAVSFKDYAPEVVEVVKDSAAKDVAVITMTDSPLSPLAPYADVCFEIQDEAMESFRSLSASMCLAQSLVVNLGLWLEAQAAARPRRRERARLARVADLGQKA